MKAGSRKTDGEESKRSETWPEPQKMGPKALRLEPGVHLLRGPSGLPWLGSRGQGPPDCATVPAPLGFPRTCFTTRMNPFALSPRATAQAPTLFHYSATGALEHLSNCSDNGSLQLPASNSPSPLVSGSEPTLLLLQGHLPPPPSSLLQTWPFMVAGKPENDLKEVVTASRLCGTTASWPWRCESGKGALPGGSGPREGDPCPPCSLCVLPPRNAPLPVRPRPHPRDNTLQRRGDSFPDLRRSTVLTKIPIYLTLLTSTVNDSASLAGPSAICNYKYINR